MYFLAIEIHNIRQISRLRPSASESLERSIDGIMVSHGIAPIFREGGLYIFGFEHIATDDYSTLATAAVATFEFLKAHADELMGFLVYLELDVDNTTQDAVRMLRREMRQITEDDALVVGNAARKSLGELFSFRGDGTNGIADGLGVVAPRPLTELARFVRRPFLYGPILTHIEEFFFDDVESGVVLIHGPRFSGRSQNISEAIRRLLGPENSDRLVRLYPSVAWDSPFAPFVNGLRSVNLEILPAYLTKVERRIWDRRRVLLQAILGRSVPAGVELANTAAASAIDGSPPPRQSGRSGSQDAPDEPGGSGTATVADPRSTAIAPLLADNAGTEILLLYGLVLKAVMRIAEETLAPAVIFFENVHDYSHESLQIAAGLLREYIPGGRLLPILVSHKPYLPSELREFPFSKLRIPSLEREQLNLILGEIPDTRVGTFVDRKLLNERAAGRVVAMFHHLRAMGNEARHEPNELETGLPGLAAIWSSVMRLERAERIVLYVVHLCSEILDEPGVARVVDNLEIPALRIPDIVRTLSDLGLVHSADRLRCAIPELEPLLAQALGEDGRLLRAHAAAAMYASWRERSVSVSLLLFERVHSAGMAKEAKYLFVAYVQELLDRGEHEESYRLLYPDCPLDDPTGSREESAATRMTILAMRLKLALLRADSGAANEAFRDSRDPGLVSELADPDGSLLLAQASYMAATGDPGGALRTVKRAIMQFQEESDLVGLSNAHCEFGLMTLAREDVAHARDYFVIAQGSVSAERNTYAFVRASTLEAASLFLLGNYSRVLNRLDMLEVIVDQAGMRRWQAFLGLLRGRVLFDLGQYAECARLFAESLSLSELYGLDDARSVFTAWMGRTHAYLNEFAAAAALLESLPPRDEALLFLAELHERSGRVDESMACLERALSNPRQSRFAPGTVPAWADGFAYVEDLGLGPNEESVLRRIIRAFHGYVRAKQGDLRGGVSELFAITRTEGLSPLDPYNSFYFYLYSTILPGTRDEGREASMEDRLTVLGKSVKHLQERSSRIDDHTHKIAFLHESYWNSLLYDEARMNNLV